MSVDDFQRVVALVALRALRASDGLAAATLPSSLAQQLPTITAGNARIVALRNVRSYLDDVEVPIGADGWPRPGNQAGGTDPVP